MKELGDSPEVLASRLLSDLSVALEHVLPDRANMPFDWLGAAYVRGLYSPLPVRLIDAFQAASPETQTKMRAALLAALDRAATAWLGSERTLVLLDWVQAVAFDAVPSSTWVSLLFHHNPTDAGETALWVRAIVERLGRWPLNRVALTEQALRVPAHAWASLVHRTDDVDRVDVAVWLLELVEPDEVRGQVIFDAVIKPWRDLDTLPDGYDDFENDIVAPLEEAGRWRNSRKDSADGSSQQRRAKLKQGLRPMHRDWPGSYKLVEATTSTQWVNVGARRGPGGQAARAA